MNNNAKEAKSSLTLTIQYGRYRYNKKCHVLESEALIGINFTFHQPKSNLHKYAL